MGLKSFDLERRISDIQCHWSKSSRYHTFGASISSETPKVLGIVVGSLLTLLVAAAVIKKGAIGVTQP